MDYRSAVLEKVGFYTRTQPELARIVVRALIPLLAMRKEHGYSANAIIAIAYLEKECQTQFQQKVNFHEVKKVASLFHELTDEQASDLKVALEEMAGQKVNESLETFLAESLSLAPQSSLYAKFPRLAVAAVMNACFEEDFSLQVTRQVSDEEIVDLAQKHFETQGIEVIADDGMIYLKRDGEAVGYVTITNDSEGQERQVYVSVVMQDF